MKALTLTQPWATLIAVGAKRIETRSWGTDYHGQLAIHAAKGLGPVGGKRGLAEQCRERVFCKALERSAAFYLDGVDRLPLGAIIAVAILERVSRIDMKLRAQVLSQTITPNEIEFGDYASGRYAWYLENVVPLAEPILCKGALSLWDVPNEVNSQIITQLEKMVARDQHCFYGNTHHLSEVLETPKDQEE
jgi:activating signal cointegrator 1